MYDEIIAYYNQKYFKERSKNWNKIKLTGIKLSRLCLTHSRDNYFVSNVYLNISSAWANVSGLPTSSHL